MSEGLAMNSVLACPYCSGELLPHGDALSCANRHSFDLARRGYVNLSLGRHPGDTKQMLLARRAFLDAGYYQPLSLAINQRIATYLSRRAVDTPASRHQPAILDAGCGEGYYTERLASYLADSDLPAVRAASLFGLDISRDAILLAAKRCAGRTGTFFIVADIKARLPFVTAGLEVLLNVFAPRNPAEFARVMLPGGLLLVVIPRPDHLEELRAYLPLLNIEAQKRERVLAQFAGAFSLVETRELRYRLSLDAEAVTWLLAMTPLRRREHVARIEAEPVEITVGFTLLSLIRS
ncbi:MAG: putative RNA methyltransferase [Ktedonobacterales bacterium]